MTARTDRRVRSSNKAVRTRSPGRAVCTAHYLLAALLFVVIVTGAESSSAQCDQGDGVYGRFNDDTILSYGVGFGLGSDASQTFLADIRARYLDSAGVVVAPEIGTNGEPAIAVAVDIRPLFLGKFFTGNFSGRSWLDLTVDSIGVELGSWFGPLDRGTGVAFVAGGGIDLPLGADGSSGLWIRLNARWFYAHERDLMAPEEEMSTVVVAMVLYFRSAVDFGIASWELPRYGLR